MHPNEFKIGENDPYGKKIKNIIFSSDTIVIYIDFTDVICWFRISSEDLHEGFGEISNKISDLESKLTNVFKAKEAYGFKCLLAEACVRILHDKNIVQARDIIDRVSNSVEKKGSELLKQYYTMASFIITLMVCIVIWISKNNKTIIEMHYGKDEYRIWMTMLFGGIGAFVFTIIRLKNYKADIEISKSVHVLDGVLRIFYGIIFGLIIAIAIKSNLLLGFLNQIDKSIYVSVFLGVCAGASEILIPSLIKQIETKVEQK